MYELMSDFPNHTAMEINLYCSDLIAKGLLNDSGAGNWDTGALEIFSPSDAAYWLLSKVEEIAKSN